MIILENISKYYYSETSVTLALRKINLSFEIGEFVAITGESGSGKSTLLRILSGMDNFDEGELYFNGQPTFPFDEKDWEDFRRNEIGFVFQDYDLILQYTVLENIVTVLLMMGITKEEALGRAKKYLQRVGLSGYENNKASELSSGQKQRLSIARALAKETYVIVADEPTGNLDSETGTQIVELLKELSKERLILMVTHNYEQAEPYVTRKIRLHDGEVVDDIRVEDVEGEVENECGEKKNNSTKYRERKIAWDFAKINRKRQKGKAFLFRTFMLVVAVVSFIFLGQIFLSLDDTYTRKYDRTIFYNKKDNRICVRKKDGSNFTDKEVEKLKKIDNVVNIDKYDACNDIVYFTDKNKDYKTSSYRVNQYENYDYTSGYAYEESDVKDKVESVEFIKKDKFMKSVSSIEKSDLKSGKMPENMLEIVVSKSVGKKVGEKIEIYFNAPNISGESSYYHNSFTVTGVVDETSKQIYFQNDFCHMLSAPINQKNIVLSYAFSIRENAYMGSDDFYMYIDNSLKEGEVNVSINHIVKPLRYSSGNESVSKVIPGNDLLSVYEKNESNKNKKTDIEVVAVKKLNDQSGEYMGVPQNIFYQFYPEGSNQVAVYIKNYTKTDKVLGSIEKMGYKGVSTYRISSGDYVNSKVLGRIKLLAISVVILLGMILTEIVILSSMMKIKIKDFKVFLSMGMPISIMKKVSVYEMLSYCLEMLILTVVIFNILWRYNVSFVSEMMIYYSVFAYLIFAIYNVIGGLLTVKVFNGMLKRRVK